MANNNVNFFPWDDVVDDSVFPSGCFHFSVEELEDGTAQSSGKRMFRGRFVCKAPQELAGMAHFENFVVGTEENPTGINPGTMGARSFKQLLKAAQVPPSNDIAQILLSAKGAELLMSLNHYVEKDGQYAGTPRNRVAGYHRLGEREVKLAQPKGQSAVGAAPMMQGGGAPPIGVMQTPTAAPVQYATPQAVQQPAQAVMQPQQYQQPIVQQAAPQAPPVQYAQPAPVQQSAPIQQPFPVAQQAAPQVLQAPPVMQAAPQAAPAAGPAEMTMLCSICNTQVPVSMFGQHVQAHASVK